MRYQLSNALNQGMRMMGCRTINAQFTFSYVVIFLLAAATVVSLYVTMQASAQTINIAGRQRMLSQKVAKEVMMVVQDVEQRETVDKTINLFESSHSKLINGDPESGIVAPATAEIEQQLTHVWGLWGEYKESLLKYMDDASPEALAKIHIESPIVLKEMNKGVGMMATAANADVQTQQLFAMIMAGCILITVLISRMLGLTWLIDQVNRLSRRLDSLAQGDFSKKITEESSDNEIGHMFKSYNNMIDKVGHVCEGINSLSIEVADQSTNLSVLASQSESGITQQNSEIEQVATAMNEMTATVQEVANHASMAAESAKSANGAANQGNAVVNKAVSHIQAMVDELNGSVTVMQQLDDDSQEIGKVLTVITGIAEQTNLLALNAAIEAARAGEQGRGFAVVADEVRTLAQRTQESTEEIQKIIERLQAQSHKAVEVMKSSTEKASSNVEQTQAADEALQNIVGAVDTISQMNTQIATAAEEQSQVVAEMDRNISNISAACGETSQSSAEVRGVSVTLNGQAEELKRLASTLKFS